MEAVEAGCDKFQCGVRVLARELGGGSRLRENKVGTGVGLSHDRWLSGGFPKRWLAKVRCSMDEG